MKKPHDLPWSIVQRRVDGEPVNVIVDRDGAEVGYINQDAKAAFIVTVCNQQVKGKKS
jgi:hypothetical protein